MTAGHRCGLGLASLAVAAVAVAGCGAPTCGQATAALDAVDADTSADARRWADEAHAELDAEGVRRFGTTGPVSGLLLAGLTPAERADYDARRAADAEARERAEAEHKYRRIDAAHQQRVSCAL